MASPGLAVWTAPSVWLRRVYDGGSVVQVNNGRLGAAIRHGSCLGVIAYQGCHLVPVCVKTPSVLGIRRTQLHQLVPLA